MKAPSSVSRRLALIALLALASSLAVGQARPPDPGGDPPPSPGPPAPSAAPLPSRAPTGPDPSAGAALYRSSCAECHGEAAEGVHDRGTALRNSEFVRSRGDSTLLEFIRKGRSPGDADHRGAARMPGRGGNTYLPDASIRDVIAYLRLIQ